MTPSPSSYTPLSPIRQCQQERTCSACGRSLKDRSNRQNKRLWKLYEYIANDTGNSKESVHAAMKELFLGRTFMTLGDKEIQIPKTTTTLSTKEMMDYMMNVEVFASELGIILPYSDAM